MTPTIGEAMPTKAFMTQSMSMLIGARMSVVALSIRLSRNVLGHREIVRTACAHGCLLRSGQTLPRPEAAARP